MVCGLKILNEVLKKLLRHSDDIIGHTQTPSPTAGDGKQRGDMLRTICCGFPIDPLKIPNMGAANEGDGFVTNDPVTGDPTVLRGGCPFCGSSKTR